MYVYVLLFLCRKTQLLKIFLNVRHQMSLQEQSKPHKEHEKMLYVPGLSVNFMLQPHKQIRTNILLSSHNLKLKFMLYTDNHRAGSHSTGACLTNPSQLTCYPRQISMLPTLYMYISVCVCVSMCAMYLRHVRLLPNK